MSIVSPLQIIDPMDDYWRFVEEARRLPAGEVLQRFKAGFIAPNLADYAYVFGISDQGLEQYLSAAAGSLTALRGSQGRLLERFTSLLERFRAAFPAFQPAFTACLLPSLGLFKGIAAPAPGETRLLLGADALAELDDVQFNGYITHELFHIYHYQRVPAVRQAADLAMRTMQMPPLWGLLWTEGLACHAVRIVFPGTPEEDVLDWRPLVEQAKSLLPILAQEARKALASPALQDIAGFFYFPRPDRPDIPTGCGYYLGMRAAEALARERSIDALLDLPDDALVAAIDAALRTIESA